MPSAPQARNPLRIGLLCHPTHGGSGVLACELALSLAARGHQVFVFAHATPPRLQGLAAEDGVELHLSNPPAYPLFEAPPNDLAMVSRILAVHTAQGLDIVHAHYALPHAASAILAAEAARDTGQPFAVVTTLHGTDITLVGSDVAFRPVVRFVLQRSDAISCVSHALADSTRSTFFDGDAPELSVIPNFVDTQRFHPKLERMPGPPRIVHASNLRPVKRVPWLIEAFAQASHPDSGIESHELWVIGDGPDLEQCVATAERLGVTARVRFWGQQDRLAPLLAGAQAFALSSETEAFGLSALEAMATGVPVVATKVGGLPELVQHDVSGFLVNPHDQECFASRLRILCVDHGLARSMGRSARQRALQAFDRAEQVDRYELLYGRARARARRS